MITAGEPLALRDLATLDPDRGPGVFQPALLRRAMGRARRRAAPEPRRQATAGCWLSGEAVDRLPDDIGDDLRLGGHDHVGALDLGVGRAGPLGHGIPA